ncbi:MAG TPA: hypothetical protein VGV85_08570 [Longimicrobiaceae bacterium]|nr:hypothetical protein [Longimicrobiaceae bacterium]
MEGVVCGARTRADGRSNYDSEEGTTFTAHRWFPSLLVAYDLRRSLLVVLPEDVEVIGG